MQTHGRCNYTLKAMSRSKTSEQRTGVVPVQVGTDGLSPGEAVPEFRVCGE